MHDDRTLPPSSGAASDEATLAAADAAPSEGGAGVEPGKMIGRFEVIEMLGAGAMGVVLAARDPTLDRKVAIKLLKPDAYGRNDERAKAALVREARTVAKLDHPNVVTVFEAGLAGEQVFVAMQFVEGGTLRAWVGASPRAWSQVLEVYLAAGRGLAAAHGAGLVHRDFKPVKCTLGVAARERPRRSVLFPWSAPGPAFLQPDAHPEPPSPRARSGG